MVNLTVLESVVLHVDLNPLLLASVYTIMSEKAYYLPRTGLN